MGASLLDVRFPTLFGVVLGVPSLLFSYIFSFGFHARSIFFLDGAAASPFASGLMNVVATYGHWIDLWLSGNELSKMSIVSNKDAAGPTISIFLSP